MSILVNDQKITYSKFPAGELLLRLSTNFIGPHANAKVEMIYECTEDIMVLLLIDNLLRKNVADKYQLLLKYFPYSRQDRHTEPSTPFSLRVMVDIIKLCNVQSVTTWDAHSDVLEALFPEGMLSNIEQQVFVEMIIGSYQFQQSTSAVALVAPDAGAIKKIHKSAQKFNLPIIKADKNRDVSNGDITSTSVHNLEDAGNKTLLIVDDLADGGRTFIELAKAIKSHPKYLGNPIHLYVTHGFFTKGLKPFEGFISKIHCANNMSGLDLKAYNILNEEKHS